MFIYINNIEYAEHIALVKGAIGGEKPTLVRMHSLNLLSDMLGEMPESPMDLRDYGIGAQILLDLGVRDMILLSNSKRAVIGLEGYGLAIKGYQEIKA